MIPSVADPIKAAVIKFPSKMSNSSSSLVSIKLSGSMHNMFAGKKALSPAHKGVTPKSELP